MRAFKLACQRYCQKDNEIHQMQWARITTGATQTLPIVTVSPLSRPASPRIVAKSVGREDAVAGNENHERVGPARLPDGLGRSVKLACKFAVGPRLTKWNSARDFATGSWEARDVWDK